MDMHSGLAIRANRPFNFCIEKDKDFHFFHLLLGRFIVSVPAGGLNFNKVFHHQQNGK